MIPDSEDDFRNYRYANQETTTTLMNALSACLNHSQMHQCSIVQDHKRAAFMLLLKVVDYFRNEWNINDCVAK